MLMHMLAGTMALFAATGELQDGQNYIDMSKVTCEEWANSASNEQINAWLYGYSGAKSGAYVIMRALVEGNAGGYIYAACEGHEKEYILDVLAKHGELKP